MHRPGAPERHQREAARIDPALHGDDAAGRASSPGWRPARSPRRSRARQARAPRRGGRSRVRPRRVERDATREVGGGVEVAEQEVGVGHRRLRPAAPVARGAGLGPRRARARPGALRRASRPSDRAAAGADRVDVDHRQLDHAAADPPRVRSPDPPPSTTHTSQEVPPMSRPIAFPLPTGGRAGRRDRATGRAREDASGRRPGPPLRPARCRPTTSSPAARGSPRSPAAVGEAARGSAPKSGGEVGVDHGRRAALVLAELRRAPRARPTRGRRAAALAARPRVAARAAGRRYENSRQTATDSAPLSRPRCDARSLRRRERFDHTAGRIRSAAPKRSSSSTRGVGFGAQRR